MMRTLRLAFRMMLRDLRAGELHLLGLAIVIAVASLTSVGFLADRVGRALDREANQLLGGDLLLRADRPWPDAFTDEARARGLQTAKTVLFTSMASTAETAALGGVKVVEDGYPLRGAVRIAPGPNQPDAAAGRAPAPGELWLDERLFAELGVKVGDTVGLGWFSGSCMTCRQCMSGNHNLCASGEQTIVGRHGGFANKVRCNAEWATLLPPGLDVKKAGPLFCGGITVFNPIVQFDVKPTDRVGVVGIGGSFDLRHHAVHQTRRVDPVYGAGVLDGSLSAGCG